MKFDAPAVLGPFLRMWLTAKTRFEAETGKSKPGGWFTNKSGVTEALKAVDAAIGDLGITIHIVEKKVTLEAVKQLAAKVLTLEKVSKTLHGKATKYCLEAVKAMKAGGEAVGGDREAALYNNSVRGLVKALGGLATYIDKLSGTYRDFADAAGKEAVRAAREHDLDTSAREKFSKVLDVFELKLLKQSKPAKTLERAPDETSYYGIAGPVNKAIEELRENFSAVVVDIKSDAVRALSARLKKYEAETLKFTGVKEGKKAASDKGLIAAIKQVTALAADTPKLVGDVRKGLRDAA